MRKRFLIPVLILVIVILLAVGLARPVHVAFNSALVALQIFHGSPIKALSFLTDEPIVFEVQYPGNKGTIEASLYCPDDMKRHGALVAFVGVTSAGRDDPRIINLGDALARAGYIVLIPEIKNLTQGYLSPCDVDLAVASFQYLWSRDFVDKERIGMMGFCVGGALATMTAQAPCINKKIRFLTVMGGYYDILGMVQAMTTNIYTYKGRVMSWNPLEKNIITLAHSLIECLGDEQDRLILKEEFKVREANSVPNSHKLSPSGRAMYNLLTNKNRLKIKELVARLDLKTQSNLEKLSPSTHIDQLCTRVFLIHDLSDSHIPYVESLKLSDAIHNRLKVDLVLTEIFRHVNPDLSSNLSRTIREAAKFYVFLYQNLSELQ